MARNGARNPGKWKKNPGGHMNTTTIRAVVATANQSSGGGGRRVIIHAPVRAAATKPTGASVTSPMSRCPGFTR